MSNESVQYHRGRVLYGQVPDTQDEYRVAQGSDQVSPLAARRADACVLELQPGVDAGDVVAVGGAQVAWVGAPRTSAGPLQASHLSEWVQQLRVRRHETLASLAGAFALAVVDVENREVLAATDRMGVHPLFFRTGRRAFEFASCASALRRAGDETDLQALYDYVYFHVVPSPRAIVQGVSRLLPGEYVWYRQGRMERGFYSRIRFEEHEARPHAELKRDFLQALEAGVSNAVSATSGKVGAFLSGGTDSSTIAGMTGKVTGRPVDTYSIGFDANGYDEMEYARTAARHFGTRHHEYYVTPEDIVEAVPHIAHVHAQPFGNASALPAYCCARLAKSDGVTLMLAGDGGDELFGGNARYAKQHLYSLYESVPAPARRLLIEPVASVLAKGPRFPVLGPALGYVQHARLPMPERLEIYNFVERFGAERIFTADLLGNIDRTEPLELLRASYFHPSAETLINRMLALDLKFTLADNDLPKVVQSCHLAGVPVAFPMLDVALVDFSARLAPSQKLKGTKLRYFFKEALRGFLPDETIAKRKQGFGLPFGPWLATHRGLRDLAFDSLSDLKSRRYVRADFIDQLRDELVRAHPGYYGSMVWVLMMLEQWFKLHVDARADKSRLAA